jgi:hypothetical protein
VLQPIRPAKTFDDKKASIISVLILLLLAGIMLFFQRGQTARLFYHGNSGLIDKETESRITSLLESGGTCIALIAAFSLPIIAILFVIGLALAARDPTKSPAVSAAQFTVKAVLVIITIFIGCLLFFSVLTRLG